MFVSLAHVLARLGHSAAARRGGRVFRCRAPRREDDAASAVQGDVKRESRFLAQYGQMVCTAIVAILVWQLDPDRSRKGCVVPTVVGVCLASFLAAVVKRLVGRVAAGTCAGGKNPRAGAAA